MTERQESQEEERWRRAGELPADVFAVFHKADRAINPISIVATVDPDGSPHTARHNQGGENGTQLDNHRLAHGCAQISHGNEVLKLIGRLNG